MEFKKENHVEICATFREWMDEGLTTEDFLYYISKAEIEVADNEVFEDDRIIDGI